MPEEPETDAARKKICLFSFTVLADLTQLSTQIPHFLNSEQAGLNSDTDGQSEPFSLQKSVTEPKHLTYERKANVP